MILAIRGCSMKLSSRNKIRPAFLFLLACFVSTNVSAQDITEDVPLSFGEIVIPSFAVVARVTINPSGGFSYNNAYLLTNPQRGEYSISGAPPNTFYNIVLPPSILLAAGGTTFLLDDLAATPGPPYVTDASGNDNFVISGRLQSQGGGVPYPDATYNGILPITLVF